MIHDDSEARVQRIFVQQELHPVTSYSYERVVLVFTSVYVCLFLRRMILFHLESKGPEPAHGPGGGGTLYNNYTGRLRPKGVPFSGWKYMNR